MAARKRTSKPRKQGGPKKIGKKRASSRKKGTRSKRLAKGKAIKMKEERYHSKIKKIKFKVSATYKIQSKTVAIINSILNDIIRNVTEEAKKCADEMFRRKTIQYIDVMIGAGEIFGCENKWINKILTKGKTLSKKYESKTRFSKHPMLDESTDDDFEV